MSMLYMAAIATIIILSCTALSLALATFVFRRRSDDRQAKFLPVRQNLASRIDGYLKGETTLGQLTHDLHDHRHIAQGLLLSRAVRATPDEEEALQAVFRRMALDEDALQALEATDVDGRVDAALRLGYMGRGRGVAGLLRAVQDPDPRVRLAAAQGLSQLHLGDAATPILRATASSGIPVSKATDLVAGLGSTAVRPLCDYLDTPASIRTLHPGMVIAACNALGMIGGAGCVDSVRRYALHPDPNVRAAVARALGSAGTAQAGAALLELARDSAWEVRAQAVRALAPMRDQAECSAALVAAIADPSWWVRQNAANTLSQQGRRGIGSLLSILNESPDIYARDAARQALEEKSIIRPAGVTLQ